MSRKKTVCKQIGTVTHYVGAADVYRSGVETPEEVEEIVKNSLSGITGAGVADQIRDKLNKYNRKDKYNRFDYTVDIGTDEEDEYGYNEPEVTVRIFGYRPETDKEYARRTKAETRILERRLAEEKKDLDRKRKQYLKLKKEFEDAPEFE